MSAKKVKQLEVFDARAMSRRAMAEGHKRAILILDGSFQFSVSIGVYTDAITEVVQ